MTELRAALLGLTLLGAIGVAEAATLGPSPPSRDCPLAVRVAFADDEHLRRLGASLDLWAVDRTAAEAVVGTDLQGLARLRLQGEAVRIDHHLTELACERAPADPKADGIPGFSCYRTVEETFARIADLAEAWPGFVELVDIGDSWERDEGLGGHDLVVLRLGRRDVVERRPALFAMGALHAREYAPAELLLRFAEGLLAGYDIDPDATWILDEHEIHLLVAANPDGRVRAEQGLLWRKNADNDFCSDSELRGVDLNRNFDHYWGCCGGSSDEPCSEVFRGPVPASEPETQAIEAYVSALFPDQWPPQPERRPDGLFLDIHAFGGLILWPWGFTPSIPPNGTGLATVARKLAWHNGYDAFQAVHFYPTDGTTPDWAYGAVGVPAYTVEVGTWFFEPCELFETTVAPDNLELLRHAAKLVRNPFDTAAGPEVVHLEADREWLRAGEPLTLRAEVSDRRFGPGPAMPVQTVARVEVWIDRPPWREGAEAALEMVAVDGELDQPEEEVEATVATDDLLPGRHTLFVRAVDDGGQAGAVSALFLWVDARPVGPRRGGERVSP